MKSEISSFYTSSVTVEAGLVEPGWKLRRPCLSHYSSYIFNFISGETYNIDITTKAQNVGNFHCPLVFFFRQVGPTEPVYFHIVRFIHARCKNALMDELKPLIPYKKPPRVAKTAGGAVEIVPGFKMPM